MNYSLEILQEKGLVFSGSFIETEILEELFKVKKEDKDFIWKKLTLKERIKLEGYFVSEKNCDEGSFRILKTDEMADFAEKKLQNNMHSNEKIALILKAHDCSSLDKEQLKKYNFIQSKAARCAASMQKELLEGNII